MSMCVAVTWPQGGLFGLRLGADKPGNDLSRPIRGDLETSFPQHACASSASSLTNTIPLAPGRATATSHRSVRLRQRRTPQPVFDLQPIRRARAGPFAWHCHSVLHGRHGLSNFYGISDQESVAPLQDPRHLRTHFHGTPQCTYIRRSCEAQVLMPGYRSRCTAFAKRLLAGDAQGGTSGASFATIFL
jgi:hypothetical protein